MNRILHLTVKTIVWTLCVFGATNARAQNYGIPQVAVSGFTNPYSYTDQSGSQQDSNGNSYNGPIDYYAGGYWTPDGVNVFDSSGNAVSYLAIAWDGYTYLNTPPGVIVLLYTFHDGADFYNGWCWVVKYYPGVGYAQFGSSPWYYFDGNSDLLLDARNGWPGSSYTIPTNPPLQIYVNGILYNAGAPSISGGASYSMTANYQGPQSYETLTIQLNASGGTPTASTISGTAPNGETINTSIDPVSLQPGTLPNDVALIIGTPSGSPANGPAYVSWDGNLLAFYYTTTDGKDLYWNAGDANGDFSVIVAQDDSVLALHGTESIPGQYNPNLGQFNFSGATDSMQIIAEDGNGNPYPNELPPGITFLFGWSGPGQAILGNDDTLYNASNATVYTYRRPDGAYGLKYTGIPDGLYLVQDETTNYTAPPYKYVGEISDTTVNGLSGWPATNIYPTQLYVNGTPCSMVPGSQYDSGAGLPRNGGVSFVAPAYDLTVVLSWSWDSQNGFLGFATGKYGQSSAFKNTWDGLSTFTSVTGGAAVSLTAPTNVPLYGDPPQVAVNGSALNFDPNATTALRNSGSYGDVYTGALGQSMTIYYGGAVSFVPGMGFGNAPIAGTFNSATQQFNFAANGAGIGNSAYLSTGASAVITATDSSGHNLATANDFAPIPYVAPGTGLTNIAGAIDIEGNMLSLGSWTDNSSGTSYPGFALAYIDNNGDPTAYVNFYATRMNLTWTWNHASSDGSQTYVQAMGVDNTHKLMLYDPTASYATPGVILDPNSTNGVSGIAGTLRVYPHGDISMGGFVGGSPPPVPPAGGGN